MFEILLAKSPNNIFEKYYITKNRWKFKINQALFEQKNYSDKTAKG